MAALGARDAINLDGGGSASLVCRAAGCATLPREEHGVELAGGRAIATALAFRRRARRRAASAGAYWSCL